MRSIFWKGLIGTSFVLSVITIFPAPSQAFPVGVIDVPSLIKQAELVVTAEIDPKERKAAIDEAGKNAAKNSGAVKDSNSADLVLLKLHVKSLLKGNLTSASGTGTNRVLTFQYNFRSSAPFTPFENQYGIYFLQKSGKGEYIPVNIQHIAVPLLPGTEVKPDKDLMQTIAREEVKILSASNKEMINGLENKVIGQSDDGHQAVSVAMADMLWTSADQALREMPASVVVPSLKEQLKKTTDDHGKLQIVSALANFKDFSSLTDCKQALCKPSYNEYALVSSLAGRMHNLKGERYVPFLTDLFTSKVPAVRLAAAYSLRDTGSQSVVKPLATKGLYDANQEVRWYSMAGLAEVLKMPQHYPKYDAHGTPDRKSEAAEAPYLKFWRDYAKGKFPDDIHGTPGQATN